MHDLVFFLFFFLNQFLEWLLRDSGPTDKVPYSQNYSFSSSDVWMWELDHKKGWALKNWCFWIVVLEKTLESSLDSKEIEPVNPKGNQPEYSLERLMLKLQYFGHLKPRANSLEKNLMLQRLEGRRRMGQQRNEMAGWHHWLNGHEFEQTPGDSEGQGSLACCSPWIGDDLVTRKQQ